MRRVVGPAFDSFFETFVQQADADPAKKQLALNLVRDCEPLRNGGSGEVENVSKALLAMFPLVIQMFLEKDCSLAAEDVDARIARHMEQCHRVMQMRKQDAGRGFDWRRLAVDAALRATWPGALVTVAILFREPLHLILMNMAGG